jgi:PAS domain S-box-containing protein
MNPPESGAVRPLASGREVLRWLVLANAGVLLLIVGLLALTLTTSRDAHRQRAFDAVDGLARGLERNIQAELARIEFALHLTALASAEPGPSPHRQVVADLRRLVPQAQNLRLLGDSTIDQKLRAAAQAAQAAQGLLVAGLRQAGPDDRWVLDLLHPIDRPAGQPPAWVAAELDAQHFDRLFNGLGIGPRSAVTLRMQDMALVARHSDPPTPRTGIGTTNVSGKLHDALKQAPREGRFIATTALDGVERANAYRRVGDFPMLVLVGMATTDYMVTWRNEARLAVGLAALTLALLAGASWSAFRAWRRADSNRLALERERMRLRALLLTASDGLHVLDRSGVLVEFSDAFAALLGRSRAELEGAHVTLWEARYAREQVDRVLRSFRVGERLDFSSIYRRPDGSLVQVDVAAVGVRLDERDLFYLAARDVTEKKRSIAALQASEAFLDRTGRIAGVGGWDLDLRSGSIRLTAQALRLLDLVDLRPGDAMGLRRGLRLFVRADRHRLAHALARARLDGHAWDLELSATTPLGRAVWLRCFGEPVRENGEVVRMIGALQDISERRARTAELRREQALRMELQSQGREQARMLRERSEMLDVMAHEVRQPLNNASAAMQSAVAALKDVGEAVASPRLARAQNVLGQVMARIDNTLAVAALLARPGPIEREDTDIGTLVAVAITDMSPADRDRVKVVRETTARTASMDMSLMRLALRNLLSNALKYSPPASTVTLRLADSEDPLGLVMDVIDHGPGVEPQLQGRLFERGARGQGHAPGTGHGLGLYIVRRVMELHGGQVQLLSTGPEGTTMRLLVADAPDD